MRVLVQDCTTFEYWHGHDQWKKEELHAVDFQKSAKAIEFCVRERFFNVQIVLRFSDDPSFDITLPIRKPNIKMVPDLQHRLTPAWPLLAFD